MKFFVECKINGYEALMIGGGVLGALILASVLTVHKLIKSRSNTDAVNNESNDYLHSINEWSQGRVINVAIRQSGEDGVKSPEVPSFSPEM